MAKGYPHITLMIGRDETGIRTTCELNALGLGLGLFQAWLYLAVFGVDKVFDPTGSTGYVASLPTELSSTILYSFLIVSAATLFFIGITNQRYLQFYVSKTAMWIGAGLCCIGTLVIFGACITGSTGPLTEFGTTTSPSITPVSRICAIVSGVLMGTGSSLLIALWGTGFSRCKFSTIVLNAAFAMAVGVVVAFLLILWIPAPISGFVTAFVPMIAIIFLWSLTPLPFYERREEPIFHPLPQKRVTYFIAMGIPTIIMGIVLGVIRLVCVGEILPSGFITVQLTLGAACATSIVIFIIAIAISRNGPYWDTLFRAIVPVVVIGAVSLPMLSGELEVVGSFFVALGYLCLEVLLWVFFADLASRFKLSPLFVFGIGRGIVEVAAIVGSAIAMLFFDMTLDNLSGMGGLALICAALMSIGYSTLPRYRELKNVILHDDILATSPLSDVRPKDDALAQQDIRRAVYIGEDPMIAVDGVAEASVEAMPEAASTIATPVPQGTDVAAQAMIADSENPTASSDASTDTSSDNDNAARKPEKGSFVRRCEEISNTYMLSRREKEVLLLLAKGHNAAFIQDKLCVSKSTAKTHINHIYKKLDIHTQQELLNMVEDRSRRNDGEGNGEPPLSIGASFMVDRSALNQAVRDAQANPAPTRPKQKNTSIFS